MEDPGTCHQVVQHQTSLTGGCPTSKDSHELSRCITEMERTGSAELVLQDVSFPSSHHEPVLTTAAHSSPCLYTTPVRLHHISSATDFDSTKASCRNNVTALGKMQPAAQSYTTQVGLHAPCTRQPHTRHHNSRVLSHSTAAPHQSISTLLLQQSLLTQNVAFSI